MTKKELIEALSAYNDDAVVYARGFAMIYKASYGLAVAQDWEPVTIVNRYSSEGHVGIILDTE